MKIIASEDCGNSPKNSFLQELTIALARADSRYVLDRVSEEVRWKIVGHPLLQGKTELGAILQKQKTQRVRELIIHHVATHGKAGAVNGTIKLEKGKTREFCHVFEFTNAKGNQVGEITSYIIESSS
jgi:hypothetical protein